MSTKRRRQAGFTVLEMGAVIFILALLATGAVLRLDAATAGEDGRALREHLVRVARTAASESAARGRTVEVVYDAGARRFVARVLTPAYPAPSAEAGLDEFERDAPADAEGAGAAGGDRLESGAPAPRPAGTLAAARVPAGWEPEAWEVGGEIVSADQWRARFYADGSRDRAGVGFAGPAGGTFSWIVPARGEPRTAAGELPAPEPESWRAGELEVRTGG